MDTILNRGRPPNCVPPSHHASAHDTDESGGLDGLEVLKAVLHAHGEGSDGAAGNLVGYAAEVRDKPEPPSISEETMQATTGERKRIREKEKRDRERVRAREKKKVAVKISVAKSRPYRNMPFFSAKYARFVI